MEKARGCRYCRRCPSKRGGGSYVNEQTDTHEIFGRTRQICLRERGPRRWRLSIKRITSHMTESSSERHQQQPRNAGIIYMQGNARWPRHFFFCKHSPHLSFPSPHNGPVSFIFSPSSFLHQRIFQRCLMGHSKRSRFHTGKGRDPTCRLRARASLTHESHFKCSARLLNSHVIRRVAQISLGKKKEG